MKVKNKTPLGYVVLANGTKEIYPMNDIFLNYTCEEAANWEALRLTIIPVCRNIYRECTRIFGARQGSADDAYSCNTLGGADAGSRQKDRAGAVNVSAYGYKSTVPLHQFRPFTAGTFNRLSLPPGGYFFVMTG